MSIYTPAIALESFQFTGSENWYKHWLGIVYTDGVKWLHETLQCYWLIDEIAMLSEGFRRKESFISVYYTRDKDQAVLRCTDGNDKLLWNKHYDISDIMIDNEAFAKTQLDPFLSLFLIYDSHLKKFVLMLHSEY